MAKKHTCYILFVFEKHWNEDAPKWYPYYYSRNGLAHKLAKYPEILDNLAKNMSGATIQRHLTFEKYGWYEEWDKLYFLAKLEGNSIKPLNSNFLVKDIAKAQIDRAKKMERLSKNCEYRKRLRESYEFRKGPVPGIHKSNYRRWAYYRIPQLGWAKRHAEDTDYNEFTKPKERHCNLPTWDDRVRHLDRSWKSSCKVRHQWEKHLSKHEDTIKIDLKDYDENIA